MRIDLTATFVITATVVGCGTEIVREDEGGDDAADGPGQGGRSSVDIDPLAECERLAALLDGLPGCKKIWDTERCTTDLEFARDYGCLSETLAARRCYASTCKDAEMCRTEIDAFVACHEERQQDG